MSEQALSETEIADFRALAGRIVPASAKYGVPGADDEAIFADMLKNLGRDTADVRAAIAHAGRLAGGPFAALDAARRAEVAEQLRAAGDPAVNVLARVVLLAYYRDDRVMLSLGLEPRPPFPKGHVLEQGDWSLLDPVRKRAPFWRKVS